MKNLLLLASLGVLGYFGYQKWLAVPKQTVAREDTAPAIQVEAIKAQQADFFVRCRVGKLFEEWKRRAVTKGLRGGPEDATKGNTPATAADMSREFEEIRRNLYSRNILSDAAMISEIKLALSGLGVAPHEIDEVYRGIVSEVEAAEEERGREERKDR